MIGVRPDELLSSLQPMVQNQQNQLDATMNAISDGDLYKEIEQSCIMLHTHIMPHIQDPGHLHTLTQQLAKAEKLI